MKEATENQAILVAGFGTTHEDAYQKSVGALKNDVRAAYPNCAVFSCCTSGMVRCALQKRGKAVCSPEEALARIAAEGFARAAVLSTHLTAGFEFEKLQAALADASPRFTDIRLSRPLLDTSADREAVLRAVLAGNPLNEGEGLLMMGHGTARPSNGAYPACNALIAQKGLGPAFVATVEAEPGLPEALKFFREKGVSSLLLAPFLLVAGEHAHEDLAGEGESWLNEARAAGFAARARLKGLGEYGAVRALYLRHLEDAL